MKYSETSRKTKQRLADALAEALTQKSFSHITVLDIVERCGVNRKTFYYHFPDIHALLCWMLEQEIGELMRPLTMPDDYYRLANDLMDYVERNEAILHNIINTVGEEGLKRALYHIITSMEEVIISGFEARYRTRFEEDFRTFLLQFLTDSTIGIFLEWIRRRKYRNRERIISYLRDIFLVILPGLIEQGNHLAPADENK